MEAFHIIYKSGLIYNRFGFDKDILIAILNFLRLLFDIIKNDS